MDIGYAGAFLGGVLTLLSPCSALLLPAFFAYAFSTTTRLVARTGLFYLGLLSTLVPLGAVFALGTVYGVAGVCTGPILGSILTVAAVGGSAAYGGALLAVFALGMALPLFVLALLWDRLGISGRRWLRPRPLTIGAWSNSWLMIISGLISVGIGMLLLIGDGTAGLGGVLTVQDQFRAESVATEAAAGIPDVAVAGVAALVLSIGMALYFKSRRNEPLMTHRKAPEAASQHNAPETTANRTASAASPCQPVPAKTGMTDDPQ